MSFSSNSYPSDIAFTPAVKAVQARKGSRAAYARMEETGSWESRITPELKAFIEAQTSVFLATANAEGQPYIQHRGGPPGFLAVLDDRSLGFVILNDPDRSRSGSASRASPVQY
jgi:predicted pyridoxine 5'-phosphate oxidase superfamily flavin-nucleotide-binding protein